ncbi:MAG TPA: ABC transporter permease [Clostridia bacterium]|nr:ABC transporter permease [Clostridia bacterium]
MDKNNFWSKLGGWFGNTIRKIGRWFKSLFVSIDDKEPKLRVLIKKDSFTAVLASLTSILIGVLFGFILLLVLNPAHALGGLGAMLATGLSNPVSFANVLYSSTPLIMTGLAVGFAFRTGLFDIGAPGQYLMGAFFALYGAIILNLPWWACLILAMIGGAIMGAIPGIFKALLNVNEVITCIMFNWIGLFVVNLSISNIPPMLQSYYGSVQADRTVQLVTVNESALIPKWGLDTLFGSNYMNIGFILAVLIAILIYVLLNKTTFGYELKACGFNKNSAKYAGINEKRSIILSMIIAGGLAGIGGGLYYLSGVSQYQIAKVLQTVGFNGIPVALLAASNPVGIIFSALFVSYITVGGNAMQPEFAKEVIDIIISVIIYLSAFSLLFRNIIRKKIAEKLEKKELKSKILPSDNAGDSGHGILPSDQSKEG